MTDRELLETALVEIAALRRDVAALRAMFPERLISISELAAMVKESKRTIYRRINEGKILAVPRETGTWFLPEEVTRVTSNGTLHAIHPNPELLLAPSPRSYGRHRQAPH